LTPKAGPFSEHIKKIHKLYDNFDMAEYFGGEKK